DPLNIHSFDDNISDGDFDSDNDGLSNYTEFFIGTNPLADDTDCDNITDYDVVTDVFNSFFIYSDTEEYVNEFKNYISLNDITN
ncbi:MAG: hypothetical protein ACI4KB_10695, partial [Oscillospiraceae bacterium]